MVNPFRAKMRDGIRDVSGRGDDYPGTADRGEPLVATPARWVAVTSAMTAAFVVLLAAYVAFAHSARTLASFAPAIAVVCVGGGGVLWAILSAEEARLARELRIARTGTPALRTMVTRRRQEAPLVGRLLSTRLGTAAVLLADGDRAEASRLVGARSPLMRGGRLDELSVIVGADLERARGTTSSLDESARTLRAMAPLGNREGDLYRTHVLVKALLQRGDGVAALELARNLASSRSEEERIYVAWLRAWFDLDGFEGELESKQPQAVEGASTWDPLPEGVLRRATLLARAHGAEKLVQQLESRVAAIAHVERQE